MMKKVSDYIADFLVEHNIVHNFTVTGGGAMHLNDSLGHKEGLENVFCNHEQACAIAAEAYSRLTRNLACVCVTSGPGGTNAITGVVGGWLDSIPMLILSGQVKRELCTRNCPELGLRQLGDQEFDIISVVKNFTKYSVMVNEPYEISYHLEKAVFLSKLGKGGPVWLDIPLDVQGAKIDVRNLRHFDAEKEEYLLDYEFCSDDAERLIRLIQNAKAPLILAGSSIRYSQSSENFLKLVRKLNLPVVTAWAANDTISYFDPCFVGVPGTLGTRAGNFAVQQCDLLISFGCRMNVRMVGYTKGDFAKNAYKVMIDICEEELHKPTYVPDWGIRADVGSVIEALLKTDFKSSANHVKWLKWCQTLKERYSVVSEKYYGSEKINPYVFTEKLFEQLNERDTIVCSNGSSCVIPIQVGRIKQGQRLFCNSGCAAMGYGLPAAIGAAVALNGGRVICLEGDGSLMMNLQELVTAKYYGLNIKIFIYNNNGYHSIRQTQTNNFKPPFVGVNGDSGVALPDYGKIAKAIGIEYFTISSENDAESALKCTLECNGVCICEVFVDEKQNFAPKSSSKILDDGRIISPSIDDMAPFLSTEEYNDIYNSWREIINES